MSQWDVVLGRLSPDTGVSPHWGGGSHNAAYPTPSTSPKTNKVSDTDQAPVGAPAPSLCPGPHEAQCQLWSGGSIADHTLGHKCSREKLLHSDWWWTLTEFLQLWRRTWRRVDTDREHTKLSAFTVYRSKQRFLTAVLNYVRAVKTQEVSLKQWSVLEVQSEIRD